jgi:hypothetical protein
VSGRSKRKQSLTKHMPSPAFHLLEVQYLLPVPQLASPSAVHAAPPPALGDGVCPRDGTGFLQRSGMSTRPKYSFRAEESTTVSLPVLAFQSSTLALSSVLRRRSFLEPCPMFGRYSSSNWRRPSPHWEHPIVGIAGVSVVTAARVLIFTTATSKSVGMCINTKNQGRDRG